MHDTPQQLFASDLDGTLLPAEWTSESRDALRRLVSGIAARGRTAVAYVTGRAFDHALDGVERGGLPVPDFLACDVGTSVHARVDGKWMRDETYRASMRAAVGDVDMDVLRGALEGLDGLTLQRSEGQAEFKASFRAEGPVDHGDGSRLVDRLRALGATVELVASVDPVTGGGLLDLLPRGAGKASAIRRIAEAAGVDEGSVLFAGDSGNDRAALVAGFRAIVVGNAPRDLVRAVEREARARGLEERIYVARAHDVGGVLEGCRHFGLLE